MSERPKRFILQAYHPEYACPSFETMFKGVDALLVEKIEVVTS